MDDPVITGWAQWFGCDRDGYAYWDEAFYDDWEDIVIPANWASVYGPAGMGPGQYAAESYWEGNMGVTFRVRWVPDGENDPPIGLSGPNGDQLKVVLKAWGNCDVFAVADIYFPEPEGDPAYGAAGSYASIETGLGNISNAAQAGAGNLGHFPDPVPLQQQQVRTLTVTNGVAETSVNLDHYMEAWEYGGSALAMAPVTANVSLSIVRLVDPDSNKSPNPASTPPKPLGNQYAFGIAMLGPQQNVHFPYLYIPCMTSVLHGDVNDLKQQGRIDWSANRSWLNPLTRKYPNRSSGSSIQPWCEDPIQPQTNYCYGLAYGQESYLPANNSDFGAVTVTITPGEGVNLDGAATAEVEVFYPATDDHHPGTGHRATPNWFYYYGLVHPEANAAYAPTGDSRYDSLTDTVYLGDDAHGGPYGLAVFHMDGLGMWVSWDYPDEIQISGIHNYIGALEHEKGHRRTTQMGVAGTWNQDDDYDQDGVLDLYELQIGLNPFVNDTTGAYPLPFGHPDYGKGDRECLCDIYALGHLLPEESKYQNDWSDDGLQYPARPDPDLFPWTYRITGSKTPCGSHQHLTAIPDWP